MGRVCADDLNYCQFWAFEGPLRMGIGFPLMVISIGTGLAQQPHEAANLLRWGKLRCSVKALGFPIGFSGLGFRGLRVKGLGFRDTDLGV